MGGFVLHKGSESMIVNPSAVTPIQIEWQGVIESAKSSLPWMDWDGLHEAVKRRNDVVHDGKLYGDAQCLEDISAIEAQLAAWAVITAA